MLVVFPFPQNFQISTKILTTILFSKDFVIVVDFFFVCSVEWKKRSVWVRKHSFHFLQPLWKINFNRFFVAKLSFFFWFCFILLTFVLNICVRSFWFFLFCSVVLFLGPKCNFLSHVCFFSRFSPPQITNRYEKIFVFFFEYYYTLSQQIFLHRRNRFCISLFLFLYSSRQFFFYCSKFSSIFYAFYLSFFFHFAA